MSCRLLAGTVLMLLLSPSHAQFWRLERDIELKRLDFHPRPSVLTESRVLAVIDLGLSTGSATSPEGDCGPRRSLGTVRPTGPNYLAVQAREPLDQGWWAVARLESSIDPATGRMGNLCGLPLDRAVAAGLEHREFGRLQLGRFEHPALAVALHADPWQGSGVGSAGEGLLYPRPVDAAGQARRGSWFRIRAPSALTYESPDWRGWSFALQHSLAAESPGPHAAQLDPSERERGAALWIRSGALAAGIAWQRWNPQTWAAPISLQVEMNTWRAFAGATVGRLATGRYEHWTVGAAIRDRQGPRPGEWRLGASLHRAGTGSGQWQLGAGRVHPLSRRTHLHWSVGLSQDADTRRHGRADAGIRHQFSL